MSGIEGIVKVLEERRQDVRLRIALALLEGQEPARLFDVYRAIVDNRDKLMQKPQYDSAAVYQPFSRVG